MRFNEIGSILFVVAIIGFFVFGVLFIKETNKTTTLKYEITKMEKKVQSVKATEVIIPGDKLIGVLKGIGSLEEVRAYSLYVYKGEPSLRIYFNKPIVYNGVSGLTNITSEFKTYDELYKNANIILNYLQKGN